MSLSDRVKNLDIADISLTKLSVLCATLVIVGFFPALLNVAWYWWLIACLVFAARPVVRFFR